MHVKDLLSHPAVYRLWQAPFAAQKLQPLVASGALSSSKSVLDIGCGPGTNARSFYQAASYLGVDISEKYVAYAAEHFSGNFRVADVTVAPPDFGRFDLVLMNSLMHHIDDDAARQLLASLPALLNPSGAVHIIDLVLADEGIPRRLALADRGRYPRTLTTWCELIKSELDLIEIQPFHVRLGPLVLWELVYARAHTLRY